MTENAKPPMIDRQLEVVSLLAEEKAAAQLAAIVNNSDWSLTARQRAALAKASLPSLNRS